MVAGHLREKRGYYHIVLSYTDENGHRKTPSKTTGLPVKGNKKRAEAMLQEARKQMEEELKNRFSQSHHNSQDGAPSDLEFTKFLLDWLEMMRNSIEDTTYGSYAMGIKNKIVPYFEKDLLTKSQKARFLWYNESNGGIEHDGTAKWSNKYGNSGFIRIDSRESPA